MIDSKLAEIFAPAIGAENVITDTVSINNAEKTNYITSEKVALIIRPGSTEELAECVKIANEHQLPLSPVSTGKNWGYGSRVPVRTNNVIVDLSRMDRILDYDEKLGYVTVEPGVSFQQLYDFLREKKSELIISITGGTTDTSVMANALERGIGTGLYADRFAFTCGLEVVLPDGAVIGTGMRRFGDIPAAPVYRWGMGPSIDGIFSQSNFGIVTRMTIWLMHCPEYFSIILYKLNDQNRLPDLVDTLRELSMSGLVRPTVTMYNDFRVFSTLMQYPWQLCDPATSSPDDVITAIRSSVKMAAMIPTWSGEISVRAANAEHAEIQTQLIRKELEGRVDEVNVVSVTKEEILSRLQHYYIHKNEPQDADIVISFLLRKYIGVPSDTAIRQAYWRKRKPMPDAYDPDIDQCGLIWVSPIVPFVGEEIKKVIGIITACAKKYHFEPALSLQCMSERAIHVIGSIAWDREISTEDEQAETFYKETLARLNSQGFYAYRDTTKGMQLKQGKNDIENSYYNLLNNIKKAIDPGNILAPGKYNIG